MSDGRTHLMANLLLTGGVYGGLMVLSNTGGNVTQPQVMAVLAGMLLGSIWVTPDIDMYGVRTAPLKAWGPLWLIWWPILRLSKHRGRSHTYFQGPLFRLLYLGVWAAAVWSVLPAPTQTSAVSWLAAFWPWAVGGYWVTQILHLKMDRIPLRADRL